MRRLILTLPVVAVLALPAYAQKVTIRRLDYSQIVYLLPAPDYLSVGEAGELATPAGTRQLMVLSADKTYLVDSITNKPVFISGDAAWSAIVELNNADAERYLRDRSRRGLNLLEVNLIEHMYASHCSSCSYGCADPKGDCPFTGAAFSTPNEAYFAQADSFITIASRHGIAVLLDILYLGGQTSAGWYTEIQAASDSTISNWGAYIGNRYRGFNNLIYTMGSDIDPRNTTPPLMTKMNEMATALHAADPNHLITSKNGGGESSLDVWSGHPWLGISDMYGATNVTKLNNEYTRPDSIPFFMDEDAYENEHSSAPLQLRTRQYWSALSGAYLGSLFGNNPIWCYNETNALSVVPCQNGLTWQSQLGSKGSVGQMWYGKLMRSREHWKMVPDIKHTVATEGYGSGGTLTVTARTRDKQTIISYIPNGNATTLTVDMSKIKSKSSVANCWWFDPSNGSTALIGSFENSGTRKFTPPDANDWVLVIDDKDAKLPPPGSADL